MDEATRMLVGALNKISEQNFPGMRDHVVAALSGAADEQAADEVCNAVLSKCYQEDCYLVLYTRLLRDMMGVRSATVVGAVDRFVEQFIGLDLDSEGCVPEVDKKGVAYDEFCVAVRAKKHLVGKNRAVLSFVKGGLASGLDVTRYLDTLHARLVAACAGGEAAYRDEHGELLLEFTADFVRTFPRMRAESSARLQPVMESELRPICSSKCRFKMMDVMELLLAR
jgi:hypothetical protein